MPRAEADSSAGPIWLHGLGLAFVLAGAALFAMAHETWSDYVSQWLDARWSHEKYRWILAGILVLIGGSLLRAKLIFFLITSALVALTFHAANVILSAGIPKAVLIVAAVGLGYLIHTDPSAKAARPSLRGTAGLLLVIAAALGSFHGWYDWSQIAVGLGSRPPAFLTEWGQPCTWLTVLFLAGVGVSWSRSRPVHFLGAVLLAALAYHCLHAGAARMVTFPELAGATVPQIEDVSYKNLELWRWVAAADLVLVACVLLYKSLGIGSLNVAFAGVWMAGGLAAYQEIGTISLMQTVRDTAAVASTGMNPFANMALPIPQRAAPGRAASGPSTSLPSTLTARPNMSATQRAATRPPTQAEIQRAKERALRSQREGIWREMTPVVWMYLTAILAGIIAVTGLSLLSSNPVYRTALTYALLFALGLGVALLWIVWPRVAGQSWLGWLTDWLVSRHKVYAVWLSCLAAMAVAGLWALRQAACPTTWITRSAVCVFLGTLLSLATVSVMIRFGGFTPLPAWTYIVLSAGQSSLMWVLLLYTSRAWPHGSTGP